MKREADDGRMGLRVSQVVDVNKGLHCFSAKSAKERRKIEALPEKENKSYLVTVGKDADLNRRWMTPPGP